MIGTDIAPRTAAVLQLLEMATPRLAELMGAPPEVAQTTEGGPAAAAAEPAVFLEVGAVMVGFAVIAPSDDQADQVANVPAVVAEHLATVLPTHGVPAEVSAAGVGTAGEPVCIDYVAAGQPVGTLVVWAGEQLADVLAGSPLGPAVDTSAAVHGAAAVTTETAPPPSQATPPSGATSDSGTAASPLAVFGNLSQVELNVTVELGSTELTIRELLDLAPGSVVRVGTQIGEPFRILVNGRPAATGDLVVVNGRLGVRIREVISG